MGCITAVLAVLKIATTRQLLCFIDVARLRLTLSSPPLCPQLVAAATAATTTAPVFTLHCAKSEPKAQLGTEADQPRLERVAAPPKSGGRGEPRPSVSPPGVEKIKRVAFTRLIPGSRYLTARWTLESLIWPCFGVASGDVMIERTTASLLRLDFLRGRCRC